MLYIRKPNPAAEFKLAQSRTVGRFRNKFDLAPPCRTLLAHRVFWNRVVTMIKKASTSAPVYCVPTLITSPRYQVDLVGRGQGKVGSSERRIPGFLQALVR